MSVLSATEPTFAGPLAPEPVSAQQQWERKLRADIESTLQEALRTLRFALESRLQQELNAGLANALHDASPAVHQALVRRVGRWSAQLPPPQIEPWAAWVGGLLDAVEPPKILAALFTAASALAPRLAIYVVRGSVAIAWRCAGLEAPARIEWDRGDSVFRRAVANGMPAQWRPGSPPPGGGAAPWGPVGGLYPLAVRGKTIAVLCQQSSGHVVAGDPGVEARLTVLARVASLSLEQATHTSGAMVLHPEAAPEAVAPEAEAQAAEAVGVGAGAATAPGEAQAPAEDGADAAIASPPEAEPGPAETFAEPSTVLPGENPGATRARRYAKVLAQDLELYLQRDRPEELAAARGQRDLYGRLREDLDKCRQSFLERYPAGSGLGLEILDSQIIAILAQGDPALMGPGYPLSGAADEGSRSAVQ